MLVIERRLGQGVILQTSDGPLTVTVERIGRGKVRFGVDAPSSVLINRTDNDGTKPYDVEVRDDNQART